mmetsp:Transcript_101137/g.294497  ORF Transcript_101137/g.294497 Transcript_101137/m.294497 type:complete len:684 (-) Transcript_101137:395-2446(-)
MVLHAQDNEGDATLKADGLTAREELCNVCQGTAAFALDAGVRLEALQSRADNGEATLFLDELLQRLQPPDNRQQLATTLLDPGVLRKALHGVDDQVQQVSTEAQGVIGRLRVAQRDECLEAIVEHARLLGVRLQGHEDEAHRARLQERELHRVVEPRHRHELQALLHRGGARRRDPERAGEELSPALPGVADGAGRERRLARVELAEDRQRRARLLVHVRVPGVPVHGGEEGADAAGLDDGDLGLVGAREHAHGVAPAHLHRGLVATALHRGEHGLHRSDLQELQGRLWRPCEAGEDAQAVLLHGRVRREGRHGAKADLRALEVQDLRPALGVDRQVAEQVQPLPDQPRGGLVGLPGVQRRGHGGDHRRHSVGAEDGLLVLGMSRGQERQAAEPALLHRRVGGVRLHDDEDHRDHARAAELRLAALVPGQLREHRHAVQRHLRVHRVVLQRRDGGHGALGLEDGGGAARVVGQGLQGRHGVADDVGVLGEAVHGGDQRRHAAEVHDRLQVLRRAGELAQGPAAVLLHPRVGLEVVQVPDDRLDRAQAAEHAAVLRVARRVRDHVVRVQLDHRILREVLHGCNDRLKPAGMVDLLEPLRRVQSVVHEDSQALLVGPLVVRAARQCSHAGVNALAAVLHDGDNLLIPDGCHLLQQTESLLQTLSLLPQGGDCICQMLNLHLVLLQ